MGRREFFDGTKERRLSYSNFVHNELNIEVLNYKLKIQTICRLCFPKLSKPLYIIIATADIIILSCCIYFSLSKWMLSPFIAVLSACYQFHLIFDPQNIANIHRVRRGQWSLPNSKRIISLIKLLLCVAFVCCLFLFLFSYMANGHGPIPKVSRSFRAKTPLQLL